MYFPEATAVRQATANDLETILDVLGDAFTDDPVVQWVTPKTKYARYAFELTVPSCLGHGHTYIATDGSGAASWLPPGVALASPVTPGVVLNGLIEYGPGSLVRALATLLQSQKRHPKEDFYYLFTIGSLRSARGRGVGSALMRAGLARCDEAHMPAYLESSNVKNLPFYRKHGFEVVDELRLAMNGPTLWLMWRPAR
ncbi:MAG: GNAT family N-acetyltransferase [Polyangiales bacterium]